MSFTEINAQSSFLKRSALMLSSESPSTSAHLLTVHDRVLRELPKPGSSGQPKGLYQSCQQQEYCPSCGTIRVPAVTCAVFTQTRTRKGARRSRSSSDQTSTTIYNCLRCHRQSTQTFKEHPQPLQANKADPISAGSLRQDENWAGPGVSQVAILNSGGPKGGTDNNASSKKRAKTRKQQGLLAALAASKPSQHNSPSTSLGLLDFLQP